MQKLAPPLLTLALGVALNAVGLLAFSLQQGDKSATALIPAFIGGVFLILGGMAFAAKLRKHTIHAALALALLLGGYCVYKVVGLLADLGNPDTTVLKMFSFLCTGAACIAYLVVGVRSFLHARSTRRAADRDAVAAARDAEAAAARAEAAAEA
ncbi:MAG: hypothetical protein AAF710_05175 [Planctomycetota bacterium]